MRLATKLSLVFLFAIFVVTGIYGVVAVRREEHFYAERARVDAEKLAAAMEPSLRVVWQQHGVERALEMLRELPIRNYSIQVRWVWFDAGRNDPFSPSASLQRFQTLSVRRVVAVSAETPDGVRNLYAYCPLDVGSRRQGGLEFTYPYPSAELEAAKHRAIVETLTLLAALVSVSGLTVVFAGFLMVGRPLRQLIAKSRRIGEGDLQGPLQLETGDELSQLAASLNELCTRLDKSQRRVQREAAERIAALEQLRHADRLRTVGRLASGIAHELGTPLNVISGRAGLIAERQLSDEEVVESAKTIKTESERMTTIIRQLLDFARRREPQRALVEIGQVAQQTVDLLTSLAEKRNIRLELNLNRANARAEIDFGQIQQVLTNVIMNALQASHEGGTVQVTVDSVTAPAPSDPKVEVASVRITVRDEGEGISRENQTQIFEPFFTTKEVGEGTGLGLSIAYRILEEHGGRIEVESELGQGSTFHIYLPPALA